MIGITSIRHVRRPALSAEALRRGVRWAAGVAILLLLGAPDRCAAEGVGILYLGNGALSPEGRAFIEDAETGHPVVTQEKVRALQALSVGILSERLAEERAMRARCEGAESFEALLSQAERKVLALRFSEARLVIDRAMVALECRAEGVSQASLGALLRLAAINEGEEGLPSAASHFVSALMVAPMLRRPEGFSPGVVEAYDEARETLAGLEPEPVVLAPLPAGYLSLWIDGAPVGGETSVPLLPGRHYLQLIDREGASLGGGAFRVDVGGAPIDLPPPSMRPASISATRQGLVDGLTRGTLSAQQGRAVDAYLRSEGLSAIWLVAEERSGAKTLVLRVETGSPELATALPVSAARSSAASEAEWSAPTERHPRAWFGAAGAGGGVAILGGILYGTARAEYLAWEADPVAWYAQYPSPEAGSAAAQSLTRRGQVGGAVAITAGAVSLGALLGGVRALRAPDPLLVGARVRLSLNGSAEGVALMGAF